MENDFNEFRFNGLDHKRYSNKYMTMRRCNEAETKVVVKVSSEQVFKTKYGYALIIDDAHVVFLKDWQVDNNYYGTEILMTKDFFIVKEWGNFPDYADNPQNSIWNTWIETAKCQDALVDEDGNKMNKVHWTL